MEFYSFFVFLQGVPLGISMKFYIFLLFWQGVPLGISMKIYGFLILLYAFLLLGTFKSPKRYQGVISMSFCYWGFLKVPKGIKVIKKHLKGTGGSVHKHIRSFI